MAIKRGQNASFTKPASERVKMKDVRLQLKEGQSVKVVVCTTEDYVQVPSHNDFGHKVYPQACHEDNCPYCEIASLGEDYKALKAKDRYKFAFAVLDTDKIMVFDATAGQGRALKAEITDYADDITDGAVFNFKRSGTGKDTKYSLSLVSEKRLSAKEKELMEKYNGYEISDEFFEDISQPVSLGYVYQTIEENFPELDVRAMFPDADKLLSELKEQAETPAETTVANEGEEELPFKA